MLHQLVITLGSNCNGQEVLSAVIDQIKSQLHVLAYTPIVDTEPIDFPYPSGLFANSVLWCQTPCCLEQVQNLLMEYEVEAGRNNWLRQAHPECIPLDADLIAWDDQILKPRDLSRPYLRDGLIALGFSLPLV